MLTLPTLPKPGKHAGFMALLVHWQPCYQWTRWTNVSYCTYKAKDVTLVQVQFLLGRLCFLWPGACMCTSISLFVSLHALHKVTAHHSLCADSLILLAPLSADCHCSLQAGPHTPILLPPCMWGHSRSPQQAGCWPTGRLRILPTVREGNQTMLNKMIALRARKWLFGLQLDPLSDHNWYVRSCA